MTHPRERCPTCDTESRVIGRGVVAPFITELVGLAPVTTADLRRCPRCRLEFFDPGYDEREMAALYGSYRSATYLAARRRWEPWYGARVNDAFAAGADAVVGRRRFMEGVLGAVVAPERRFDCVVDFGGDEGQFFPDVAARRRVVVDLSDKPLQPGVERRASLDEVEDSPDLVVIAHVLEHLSDPLETLREIRRHVRPDGLLYVEVPLDRPRLQAFHASSGAARWRDATAGRRLTFVPVDFVTGVARQYRRRVPKLGALKMSEHLNYFDLASLQQALRSAGFSALHHVRDPDSDVGGLRMGRMGVVAAPVDGIEGAPG